MRPHLPLGRPRAVVQATNFIEFRLRDVCTNSHLVGAFVRKLQNERPLRTAIYAPGQTETSMHPSTRSAFAPINGHRQRGGACRKSGNR
jgi:hypothetical protein